MARPRVIADNKKQIKSNVAETKSLGASTLRSPGVQKNVQKASTRIIKADKADKLGASRKKA